MPIISNNVLMTKNKSQVRSTLYIGFTFNNYLELLEHGGGHFAFLKITRASTNFIASEV